MKKRIQLLVQLAVPHLRIRTYIQSYYLKTAGSLARLTAWQPCPENRQTRSLAALAAVLGLADSGLILHHRQVCRDGLVPLALLLPLKQFIKLLKMYMMTLLPKKKLLAIIQYTSL